MKLALLSSFLLLAAVGYGQKWARWVLPEHTQVMVLNYDFEDTLQIWNQRPYYFKIGPRLFLVDNGARTMAMLTPPIREDVFVPYVSTHETIPNMEYTPGMRPYYLTSEEYARVLLWRNQEDLKKRKKQVK